MAAPLVKFYGCFDGGVGLRQKLLDSGPTAVWPLSDMYGGPDGGEIQELVADRVGAGDNVGRGDPGMLPEYGCSTGFLAAGLREIEIDHAAAWDSTGPIAWAVMFKAAAFGIAQTLVHKSGHYILHITSGDVLTWSVHIATVLQTVTYTITDTADWIANPRLLVARYTGAALQIYEITSDGDVNQLATAAHSGSSAPITASQPIFVGKTNTSTNFLSGSLQYLTHWVEDYPSDADLADFATSLVWTEFTADVAASAGFEAQWGIPESSPAARCSVPGTMQFTLRNGVTNSTRTPSYYTLGHASVREGFALGMMMRLDLIDQAAPTAVVRRFVGRLIAAAATTGRYHRVVRCTVTDYFDELQRAQLPSMPIVENQTYATVIAKILTALAVKPHQVTGTFEGSTFAYGLDQAQDEESSTLDELERLAVSEWGHLYMKAGGVFRRDSRRDRQEHTTPDYTFDDSMHGLELDRNTREEIITKVQVAVYPRSESAGSSEVVWTLGAPIKFEPGQTRIIQMPYTDADNPDARIGVVDGTHNLTGISVNSAEDGSGTAASLTGSYTHGANSTTAFLTNSGFPFPVWLRTFTLQGKTVSTYQAVNVNAEATDTLRGRVGDNVFRVEQPYADDPTAAGDLAEYLLAGLQVERPSVRTLRLTAGPAASATVVDCVVNVEVGDLIHLTESTSGVDEGYFVNGIRLRGKKGESGTEIVAELTMARREFHSWVLGVAGYSELGSTSYPGY